MKRISCAMLALLVVCTAGACTLPQDKLSEYETGYDAGFRAGYTIGKEAAAAELDGQQVTDYAAILTAREGNVAPSLDTPPPAMTPLQPMLTPVQNDGAGQGFVDTPMVTPAPVLMPTPDVPRQYGTVSGMNVNMRSGPGPNYEVVRKVSQPERVEIYGKENGWYRSRVQEDQGYIHMDYVQVDASGTAYVSPTPAPTPQGNRQYSSAANPSGGTNPATSAGSDYTLVYVWLPESGTTYHSINNCGTMTAVAARRVTLTEAKRSYTPCKNCNPPV